MSVEDAQSRVGIPTCNRSHQMDTFGPVSHSLLTRRIARRGGADSTSQPKEDRMISDWFLSGRQMMMVVCVYISGKNQVLFGRHMFIV